MNKATNLTHDLTSLQTYLFHEGTNYRSYEMLGSIFIPAGAGCDSGFRFAVWAPNASHVSLVGDFNGWLTDKHPMKRVKNSGIWCIFVPGIEPGERYKYAIASKDGKTVLKADPFAFCAELRPNTASVTYRLDLYEWKHSKSSASSAQKEPPYESPMLIYEVHAGSWKRHKDGAFLNYRELADELVPYLTEMGYTHVELMPLCEHPYDASWGYQVTGYFAATRRYGDPEDLMYFVDSCHSAGIKVIMDWVPAHFPKDAHGLRRFDGTFLYEYEDPLLGEHPHWGTLVFDYSKPEVRSFLVSSAMFWLDIYRIDGLRVDAVSSMIYRDYGREQGEWLPNREGGNINLEAVEFLQYLNKTVFAEFPNALMIAEEATAFPKVTMPVHEGGLGFNYKWNMGWMNDTLKYFSMDPVYRKDSHHLLTFLIMYTYSENFILPLSHDEVVHGKKSLLDKMYGTYEQKFASLRAFYAYMMALPGKKLLFMGGEFGQFIEWKYDSQLDWLLLDYDSHNKLQNYTKELNLVYHKNRCLWQLDHVPEGFEWIEADDNQNSIVAFMRRGRQNGEYLIAVSNFTPVSRMQYSIRVPTQGEYYEVLHSDWKDFGGSIEIPRSYRTTREADTGGNIYSIRMDLAPLSTVYLRKRGKRAPSSNIYRSKREG